MMNEDFMKQIVFQTDNISLLFLSPYVDVVKTDGQILLKRHDSQNMIVFEPDVRNEAMYTKLLENLSQGAKEEEIKEILTAIYGDEADMWYENLIWEGIIE